MKQEEKQLLIKDLYARQLYGVKVSLGRNRMNDYLEPEVENVLTLYYINPQRLECVFKECWWTAYVGAIRPYLRPLSNMSEEEKKDILQSLNIYGNIDNEGNLLLDVECNIITLKVCKKYLGELNKRMFDVCDLIEKGLALEAHKNMYNIPI